MRKKQIRYIINPRSGAKGKAFLPAMIEQFTDKNEIDFEICFTEAPKHATVLARQAAEMKYDIVVAVGGDGSVNETAKGLLGSDTALGIVPTGSGNGMARHLKIPLHHPDSIRVVNQSHRARIDSATVNSEFCLGTFGIGFDAHIAHLFSMSTTRGYSTYVKLVLSEFYKYKPKTYRLDVDGQSFSKECFLLTFANSSQFGNNAVIAPFADISDGILEISMMRKFPLYSAPHLIYRLMHNTIHQSRYFERSIGKIIKVKNPGSLQGHIDGEPVTFQEDVTIAIVPASISVIIPGGL